MWTDRSLVKSYSWEEFGEIVMVLSEQLKGKRISKLVSNGPLSHVLTEVLNRKVHFVSSGEEIVVGLDNLVGLPDVVVTKFVHEEDEFQYHEPEFYFDSITVDVENRLTKVTFPWE